ncbi:MAG: ATP-binding protein [Actinobacteria bacterium]|nr:ATP-binding protein [Actinomycetota bacterium]
MSDKAADRRILGQITKGSLISGLQAKLSDNVDIEDVRIGTFAVVDGDRNRFFSLLKDVSLASTNEDILLTPPTDDFDRRVHLGVSTYYELSLQPMLVAEKDAPGATPLPSTTVPPHFSTVFEATPEDVEQVFGKVDEFHPSVGSPIFMNPTIPVCLDLRKLAMRSNALFGRSGCGKSVLARIILGYLMQTDAFVNLVFDMHNEFGWTATSEEGGSVDSLRKLLGQRVAIFTLDPKSPLYGHGQAYDFEVQVPLNEIRCSDMELLGAELALSQAQRETMYKLEERWGEKTWLARFLKLEPQEIEGAAEELGATNVETLKVLSRKLGRFKKLPFLKEAVSDDTVRRIRDYIGAGKHVVIQFGRYNDLLTYILVANILTRRLHEDYARDTDAARAEGREGPTPLIITIEEAHKFLDPSVAGSTVFGAIAREARKYRLVLFLIDQRPSGIDDEILSQVGTRIVGKLDDERDIDAALSGRPNQGTLKVLVNNMVERQFLLTGYALPMPVVIDAKEYGSFCKEMQATGGRVRGELERRKLELTGDDELEL